MKIKNLVLLLIVIIVLINSTITTSQYIQNKNTVEEEQITVLVTGFGPFSNFDINPSELIAEELNGTTINNAEIIGLPVTVNLSNFTESIEIVYQAIQDYNPDYVFSIGLAAGEDKIRIEKIGYNLKTETDSSLERIIPNGRWFRLSPFPVLRMVRELRKENIPSYMSLYGGLSLCNGLLYSLLYHIDENDLKIKSGFIHVPMCKTEEKPDKMELETMVNATKIIIQVCLDFY